MICPHCKREIVSGGFYVSHPLYRIHANIKQRCGNPKNTAYGSYGGRGISLCSEWLVASVFIDWCLANGWEKGLDIDRIDNDGNYEPSNCRFVTRKENINNSRVSANPSGFSGVVWMKTSGKWKSEIIVKGKRIYLGCFKDLCDAVMTRNSYIVQHGLESTHKIEPFMQ